MPSPLVMEILAALSLCGSLEDAVLADRAERFWVEVHAQIDLSENRPGKLLRGYIRALTSDSVLIRESCSPTSLLLILGLEQPIQKLPERDAHAWREAFAIDGIDSSTSLALRFAAEKLASAVGTPYLTMNELVAARRRLLELAEIA
ncbi:hypothetical protein [Glutamicibacter sp.]|uniref:hypothetical protein n=2 Tax=Glutamicibacter sp. TaxID=1931995 RepID=UPI002B49A83B|nr:hypothetical protein [Glutamicibacter sp.]HJX78091.1 hypothetical protein [Glutamicibacter sp.]